MVGLAQVDSGTSSDSQVPTPGGDSADPIPRESSTGGQPWVSLPKSLFQGDAFVFFSNGTLHFRIFSLFSSAKPA